MNPENDLLRQLGDLARERHEEERRRLGEVWDRLAAGELSVEEMATLEELAAQSPEAADALAAFRPLGDEFHARVVDSIQAQRALAEPAGPGPREPAAKPLPFAQRVRVTRVLGIGAALAATLAAVLLTWPRPTLPAYATELAGGNVAVRGAGVGRLATFDAGSQLELVLRPSTDVAGTVELRCKIARAGTDRLREWPPCARAQRAAGGALRVAGTVGREVPFQPGDWTLWVIVQRESSWGRRGLPDDRELARLAPGAALHGSGWTAVRIAETLHFGAP